MVCPQSPAVRSDTHLLRMTRAAYKTIEASVGSLPAETGGMLGGSRADGVVRHFHFDQQARRSGASYSPDVDVLNGLLRDQWNPEGINLLGFIHSHPPYLRKPSGGDLLYAQRILAHNPEMKQLLLPIAASEPDTGRFEIHPFAVVRDGDKVRAKHMALEVVEAEPPVAKQELKPIDIEELALAVVSRAQPQRPAAADASDKRSAMVTSAPTIDWADPSSSTNLEATFCRVQDAYDLARLAAARVIVVGTGGAAQFLEDLARTGVGEFLLVDPDTVSETNLATQQTYRRDIGRPKVDCLRERILDINPNALVQTHQRNLDEIDDGKFRQLAMAPWRRWKATAGGVWGISSLSVPVQVTVPPAVTLLCGLTDNFEAQARVNRLALQLALPSLCAQVYQEGRGAEITFTYPGLTPACHRCVLRSRYEAYLKKSFRNDVTSDGTPIFATTRLNALKGFLSLALLHYGSNHPRWGGLAKRIGNRNLVQIRMDPDLPLRVFDRVFGGGDRERILFDDVVWLPQQPDCPANGFPTCPDCGGTGDLRRAKGTFTDTRLMRR
jgi:proteasome lid subunit RPN8/RPN11